MKKLASSGYLTLLVWRRRGSLHQRFHHAQLLGAFFELLDEPVERGIVAVYRLLELFRAIIEGIQVLAELNPSLWQRGRRAGCVHLRGCRWECLGSEISERVSERRQVRDRASALLDSLSLRVRVRAYAALHVRYSTPIRAAVDQACGAGAALGISGTDLEGYIRLVDVLASDTHCFQTSPKMRHST